MKNRFRKSLLIVSAALSGLFWFSYYDTWFKRRDCFNELGRCFDSETGVVYLEQSGAVWLALAILTGGISLYQLWRLNR